jgi:hypothetical protein
VTTFTGSCHCKAVGFSFETAIPVSRWSVRECQCAFCRRHGARTTSDPAGRLSFHAKDENSLQHYRFGMQTADFLVCRVCGVYIGAEIKTPHGAFGIINTLALEPTRADLPPATAASYDAERADERISRRQSRWTPLAKVM